MVLLAIFGLLAVGSFVVNKFQSAQQTTAKGNSVPEVPRGVNAYNPIPAPNRGQQLLAYKTKNANQTTPPGYSPPLGPYENQPCFCSELVSFQGGGIVP